LRVGGGEMKSGRDADFGEIRQWQKSQEKGHFFEEYLISSNGFYFG
jgi:hypothetical protein